MSDDRLRDLKRRWENTGSIEDETAFLLECVRVGKLTQERMAIAGYLGHESSRQALGSLPTLAVLSCAHDCKDWLKRNQTRLMMFPDEQSLSFLPTKEYPPRAPVSLDAYIGWTSFLLQFPLQVQSIAAIAATHEALLVWDRLVGSSVLREAVDAAAKWVDCPSEEKRSEALEAIETAEAHEDDPYEMSDSAEASLAVWANGSVSNLRPLIEGSRSEQGEPPLEAILRYAAFALAQGEMPEGHAPTPNVASVLTALQRDLIPWALKPATS